MPERTCGGGGIKTYLWKWIMILSQITKYHISSKHRHIGFDPHTNLYMYIAYDFCFFYLRIYAAAAPPPPLPERSASARPGGWVPPENPENP